MHHKNVAKRPLLLHLVPYLRIGLERFGTRFYEVNRYKYQGVFWDFEIIATVDYSDILQGKEISINTLLKDAIYVNKNRKLAYALEKIQKSRMHMAIVIDNNEDHNFLGIVTLEDILEELVGEIYDEYDDLPTNVLEIGLHTFQINPNIEIKTFFNKYLENTNLPNTKAKTFTGWIQELSNGRPKKNQEFNYENIKITILSLDGKIPTKLEVTFTSNYEDDNDLL